MSELTELVKNILLRHLPVLRSLDFGTEAEYYMIRDRSVAAVWDPLNYLYINLPHVSDMICILSTPPLPSTLCQLYVTIRSKSLLGYYTLSAVPRIPLYDTFT